MTLDAVSRIRGEVTGEDVYGNPITEDVTTALQPALFAPGGSTETVEVGRDPVVTSPTLYWRNAQPDVVESDRLVVRGTTWQVQGEPGDWRGSRTGGLVVELKRAAG